MANSISGDREIKMMQAYWDSMEREFMMKAGQIAIPGEIENNHENSFFSEQIYEQLPFPLSYITDPFKPGREKDMALLTGLVLLSGCFGNVQGVYDGRIVYPMLFVFISAPAAFGKGNVSLIRLILKEVEKKDEERV